MNEQEYRAHDGIGGSDARAMAMDFDKWAFEREMQRQGLPWAERKDTAATAFGTAMHMACLEPEKFESNVVEMEYCPNFTLKAGRAIKDEAKEKAAQKPEGFVLKAEEAWAIRKIQANFQSLFGVPDASSVEQKYFGEHKGLKLKGMVDWLSSAGVVLDLKSTRDYFKNEKNLLAECYHVQLYHYALLAGKKEAGIIWIEKAPPFRVEVRVLTDEEFERAKRSWHAAMEKAGAIDVVPF